MLSSGITSYSPKLTTGQNLSFGYSPKTDTITHKADKVDVGIGITGGLAYSMLLSRGTPTIQPKWLGVAIGFLEAGAVALIASNIIRGGHKEK